MFPTSPLLGCVPELFIRHSNFLFVQDWVSKNTFRFTNASIEISVIFNNNKNKRKSNRKKMKYISIYSFIHLLIYLVLFLCRVRWIRCLAYDNMDLRFRCQTYDDLVIRDQLSPPWSWQQFQSGSWSRNSVACHAVKRNGRRNKHILSLWKFLWRNFLHTSFTFLYLIYI